MSSAIIWILNLATLVFVARAILSWFPIGLDSPARPVVDMIHRVTEPVLAPVRGVLPPMGGFDISVMLVILAIQVVAVPVVGGLL